MNRAEQTTQDSSWRDAHGEPLKIGDGLQFRAANGKTVPAVFVGRFGHDMFFGWKTKFLGRATSLIRIDLRHSSLAWEKPGLLAVTPTSEVKSPSCAGICEMDKIPETVRAFENDFRYWIENVRYMGFSLAQNTILKRQEKMGDGSTRMIRMTDNSPAILEHLKSGKPAVVHVELQNGYSAIEMGRSLHFVYDENLKARSGNEGSSREFVQSAIPLRQRPSALGFEGTNAPAKVVAFGAFKRSPGRWVIVAIDPHDYWTKGPSLKFIEAVDLVGGRGLAHANPGIHKAILFDNIDELLKGPSPAGEAKGRTGQSSPESSDVDWALNMVGAGKEAGSDEILRLFREKAFKLHPDHNDGLDRGFNDLLNARKVLEDAKRIKKQ